MVSPLPRNGLTCAATREDEEEERARHRSRRERQRRERKERHRRDRDSYSDSDMSDDEQPKLLESNPSSFSNPGPMSNYDDRTRKRASYIDDRDREGDVEPTMTGAVSSYDIAAQQARDRQRSAMESLV